jgi:hypothetical protein
LRRFIRSFGIVQSASLQLISLHVALGSSLYRCRAGDVMRVPRNKAPWAWVRDGRSCSVIECPAPALPGHGKARKSGVSALADDEVLSDDKIAANARVHIDPEQICKIAARAVAEEEAALLFVRPEACLCSIRSRRVTHAGLEAMFSPRRCPRVIARFSGRKCIGRSRARVRLGKIASNLWRRAATVHQPLRRA